MQTSTKSPHYPREGGSASTLPGSRILIDLHLDEQHRIVEERIVSPGHEITRTFTYDGS